MGEDWRVDRIGAARRGDNPMVLARMRSGFAVIGDTQHLPGYCVLLADAPGPEVADVDHLTDLGRADRAVFLTDMGLVGEAVFAACNGFDPGFRRVNYEILGNTDHYLHAHVHARYSWEPVRYRDSPVSRYPDEERFADEHAYADERHGHLRAAITRELEKRMAEAYA